MSTVFEFTIASEGFFPNRLVDKTRLASEVRASVITIALDTVAVVDGNCVITFKANLPEADVDALTAVVQSHSGSPMQAPTTDDGIPIVALPGPLSADGMSLAQIAPRSGRKAQLISQNFCDQHSWYATSQRHTGLVLSDSGDGKTWTVSGGTFTHCPLGSSTPFGVVDVTHGRITQERRLRSQYRSRVYVNGVEKTEKDPHDDVGDWVIDVDTGAVTFDVSHAGDTVTLDCSEVVNSKWYLQPLPGKKLRLISAELQFSTDAQMEDTFIFQTRGDVAKFTALAPYCTTNGGPYPPGFMMPLGDPTCYQTVSDLICESNRSHPSIPALKHSTPTWRDTKSDVLVFNWEYGEQATVDITSGTSNSDPNDIEISLEHDREMPGTFAVVTFYALTEDI